VYRYGVAARRVVEAAREVKDADFPEPVIGVRRPLAKWEQSSEPCPRDQHRHQDKAQDGESAAASLARRRCGTWSDRHVARHDPKDADRLGNVLDPLRPNIIERNREFVLHLIEGAAGNADATRLGKALEPCGDIHCVAEQIAILHHHVADIDADAEPHLTALR
jgi:hypothetical protein